LVALVFRVASGCCEETLGGIGRARATHLDSGVIRIAARHGLPHTENQPTVEEQQTFGVEEMDALFLSWRIAQAKFAEYFGCSPRRL
jgi:hypothetical protein